MVNVIVKFAVTQLLQVARRNATEGVPYSAWLGGSLALPFCVVHDLKNPPTRAVDLLLFVVVAFADVRPIGDIDAAVRAVFGVHTAEPRVLREAKIGRVVRNVTA